MIPRTFPSSRASNGSTQMIVYFLPSVSGLTRWVDYIPVKFTTVATAATENTYNQNGYIPVVSISSIAGATPFKEYVPVFLDSSAADAEVWKVNITGFIPVGTAGIGGAALYMDFAATTTLDPRVTFSRTTNATLTNSAGLVANAPMNLLTFSEQFDNAAWGKLTGGTGVTPVVTANVAMAPNGTMTADRVQLNAGSNGSSDYSLLRQASAYPIPFTRSLWVKSNTGSPQTIALVATNSLSKVTVPIEWTRVSQLQESAGALQFDISVGGTAATPATADILVWGAQLELGSTATAYNPTTVKNLLGYTENFDNAAWTKSNAFVQTNVRTYSEQFDDATWAKTNATVTANTTAAPDNSLTADKLIATAVAGQHRVVGGALATSTGARYTMSLFAKQSEYSKIAIGEFNNGAGWASFDVSAGTVLATGGTGTPAASIVSVGNGWFRCVLSFTAGAFSRFDVYGLNNAYTTADPSGYSYPGDDFSGIYIWGAQLVQGTSAGDYKATYAAAAAVGYTDIYGQPFAQKLVSTTTTAEHYTEQSITAFAGTATASIYAKAGEYQWVVLKPVHVGVSGDTSAIGFNLTTLQWNLTGLNRITNYGYVDMGNGLYRVWCTFTTTAAVTSLRARFNLSLDGLGASFAGDGTSGIYIFGAQLSDSASVDPYVYQPVAAPSSVAYYGPRFDYDPVTLAPKGLLIEEQRTNLLTYSEQFDNAAWTKAVATISANQIAAPDGATTADKLVESAGTGEHYATQSATLAATTPYTVSVYAKSGERTKFAVQTNIAGAFSYAKFDLTNGSVISQDAGLSASIVSAGNGWFRCIVTAVANASASKALFFQTLDASGAPSYAGTAGSGLYLWGAQLEAGAFATSYIPTVASQATRAADSASMIGNNFARWYNVNEGTLFGDASSYTVSGIRYIAAARTTGATDATNIGFSGAAGLLYSKASAVDYAFLTSGTVSANTFAKVAGAYKINDFALSVNAGTAATDTSGQLPVVDQMLIGNFTNSNILNGTIKRISYYNRRLSNTELQGITA